MGAHVPEGASTGALGVSNLESIGRAFFDLLGVTRRLQREVVASCRYFIARGQDRLLPQWIRGLSKCLTRGRVSREFSRLGPGTPLFDRMFALVLEFCRLRTNGDDDWLTSPLFSRMRGGRSRAAHLDRVALLRPQYIGSIAARDPFDRNFAMRILNRWAIAREHKELQLPVRLNPEKGSEGPYAADFNMNSSRPLRSKATGRVSCYNKNLTLEEDFASITHPDRTMDSPCHTALRLSSLSTLSPDPFTYSLLSLMFQGVVADFGVDLDSIPIDLEQAEANRSLYQLQEAKAVDSVLASNPDGETVTLRFPSYSSVLELHGMLAESSHWRHNRRVREALIKVDVGDEASYLSQGEQVGSAHDGSALFDSPLGLDLKGEIRQKGPDHNPHFDLKEGPFSFGQ